MKKATAKCYWCEKEFQYFQYTKPRRYCSGHCEYHRERWLQKQRRARARAARSGTLNPSATLTCTTEVVH